jgi:hypothetical protein
MIRWPVGRTLKAGTILFYFRARNCAIVSGKSMSMRVQLHVDTMPGDIPDLFYRH